MTALKDSAPFVAAGLYVLLGSAAAGLAFGLASSQTGHLFLYWAGMPGLVAECALAAVLVVAPVWDWFTETVPNWVALPLLAFGLVSFAWRWHAGTLPGDALWIAGGGWAVCLWAFFQESFCEGDVKLAMALLVLFPDMRFVLIVLCTTLAGSLLAIALLRGRAGWKRFWSLLVQTARTGRLPSPAENRAALAAPGGAHRSAWMFSVAALIFLRLSL